MLGDKSKNQKRIHPTEKPISLYDWIHYNYTKPGDKVLSNYVGSGADALSATKFDIHFEGAELDPNIFQKCSDRLKIHKKQLTLF